MVWRYLETSEFVRVVDWLPTCHRWARLIIWSECQTYINKSRITCCMKMTSLRGLYVMFDFTLLFKFKVRCLVVSCLFGSLNDTKNFLLSSNKHPGELGSAKNIIHNELVQLSLTGMVFFCYHSQSIIYSSAKVGIQDFLIHYEQSQEDNLWTLKVSRFDSKL